MFAAAKKGSPLGAEPFTGMCFFVARWALEKKPKKNSKKVLRYGEKGFIFAPA